jgi:hypothetical protein
VDAFELLPDGSIIISGDDDAVNVPGVSGENEEDLLRCVGAFGPSTSCTWSMYFDGSAIGMTSGSEDIDGVAVKGSDLYLSTEGGFSVSSSPFSLSAGSAGSYVWICHGFTSTSCSGGFSVYWTGSGLSSNDVDAIDVP